jgi:hypothetical protein
MAVLSGQKGVYLPFLGLKSKIDYLGIFNWIFLYQVKKMNIIRPHAKF